MTAITKQLGLPDSAVNVRRLPTKRSERLSGGNCPKVVANDRKHRRCKLNLHPKGLGKCQPVSCLHPLNPEVVSSFRSNQRRSTTNHSMALIRSANGGGEVVRTKVFTALHEQQEQSEMTLSYNLFFVNANGSTPFYKGTYF